MSRARTMEFSTNHVLCVGLLRHGLKFAGEIAEFAMTIYDYFDGLSLLQVILAIDFVGCDTKRTSLSSRKRSKRTILGLDLSELAGVAVASSPIMAVSFIENSMSLIPYKIGM